jgi:type IV secretory pathway VirB2 component (pilin)
MRKLSSFFLTKQAHRDRAVYVAFVLALLLFLPLAAHASPFDQGISSISDLFTGTLARAGSLIACVLGGLGFAFGDQGAKKNLAGVVFGVGIALLAANVLSWLWAA